MSIFQISKKIINNIKQYVYYPNTFFDINHMENMTILQENSQNCIVMNHLIEQNNIKRVDEKTVEVYVMLACDIVFDFEIFDPIPRVSSELICDGIVIHKNVDNIKYENAFPIASSGCNFIKLLLKYNEEIDVEQIQISCKYGLLPMEVKGKLKKLDIHKICEKRMKQDDWIIC
jgi:hypothetical protein